jgi:hypothetical protein
MVKGKHPKPASHKPGSPKQVLSKTAAPKTTAPKATAVKAATAKAESGRTGKARAAGPPARIFPVDTRFQQLARRSGGVPRDRAIERAQTALEEVKPGYDEWLEREVKGLADLVKNVEAGKEEPGWVETATFRSRQLRDSSGSLGYELLAFISGSLCELLDSIEAGSDCNMESIICHIDALMLARQGSYRRMRPEQVPELTKGLQRVVKHVTI